MLKSTLTMPRDPGRGIIFSTVMRSLVKGAEGVLSASASSLTKSGLK